MPVPVCFVASPLGDRTGGPEALSLLVHSMRQRGVEAYLLPMRNFRGRANHPEYSRFDAPVAASMRRSDSSHLVLTEVSPIESRRELERTPDANVWMLWLSVNFSPIPAARYYRAGEASCSFVPEGADRSWLDGLDWYTYDDEVLPPGAFRTLREGYRRRGGVSLGSTRAALVEAVSIAYAERVVRRPINFGTQSFYGRGFVSSVLGRDAFMLTDYPRRPAVAPSARQRNLVLYNGAKGGWKLPALQERLPEVEFRPIQGLSFDEVCQLLSSAALYVELGHMPGRDRLPREAANYGTPTVMLARGAGYCWADFPIGERYRIPYTMDWADRMAPVIREVLADPTEINAAQEPFREWVAGEPARYEAALDAWLERLHGR